MKFSDAVVRILAAQGQQIVECDAKLLLGVPPKVLFDESRSEAVKAGGDGRVGGEEVSRPRGGQRDFEWLRVLFHEIAGAFQNGEGGMPFIQVTDFRLDAQGGEQAPSADAQEHLLLEAQLRPAPYSSLVIPRCAGKFAASLLSRR